MNLTKCFFILFVCILLLIVFFLMFYLLLQLDKLLRVAERIFGIDVDTLIIVIFIVLVLLAIACLADVYIPSNGGGAQ